MVDHREQPLKVRMGDRCGLHHAVAVVDHREQPLKDAYRLNVVLEEWVAVVDHREQPLKGRDCIVAPRRFGGCNGRSSGTATEGQKTTATL